MMTTAPPERLILGRLQTPIGTALLVSDEAGRMRAFNWADHEPALRAWLNRTYAAIPLEEGTSPAARAFAVWFAGDMRALSEVSWESAGTPFQREVWRALTAIPAGETWSYRQFAAHVGRPTAVRAVGRANGANPLALVLPCHRVIGADGSLTGYGGGLFRKKWLIEHERRWTRPMGS